MNDLFDPNPIIAHIDFMGITFIVRKENHQAFKMLLDKTSPEKMIDTAPYAPRNQASKEAAKKIKVKLTGIRDRVYNFIGLQGRYGATGSEVAEGLDILPYTAKPRCSELRDAGFIVDSGMTRKNKNGSNETVWVLAVDNAKRTGDNPATL